MTTQESLLALATQTYKNKAVTNDSLGIRVWNGGSDGTFPVKFDPANNSEQAMEVLCWLATRNEFRSIGRKNVNFTKMVMARVDQDGRHALRPGLQSISHDNTPASLRAAIVQAACRVVQS